MWSLHPAAPGGGPANLEAEAEALWVEEMERTLDDMEARGGPKYGAFGRGDYDYIPF